MRLLPVLAALSLSGCSLAQTAIEYGGGSSESDVAGAGNPENTQQPGHKYLRFTDTSDDLCAGPLTPRTMPCRLILNVCINGTTLFLPANFACSPETPTLAEACAEQPEYGYFYRCRPTD